MHVCMLSGPGLPPPRPMVPPPPPSRPPAPVPPHPRTAPAPSSPAQPERTRANQREGTMENEPHQSRDRGTVCKEKRAILYGNEHVTMTLLLTSGSKPYHTYLCRTHCPTQAGRGQPKRPQATPHRGGGDKARNDDITTNKRQQPYHTSVERGGANQKDHRPHSTGGGGEPTRPNKTRRGKQQGQTRQLPT